ncbi:uncharacterized protein LOC117782773 [Drosophila innubila]|uniref:uncharacterized protein LOC117782773 n=1 Tax=Drosophila innubila TaxID=198719 RepID=UPI00148DC252|nr:uncharacterized protein LOC117782773 [Drosophila innubila]
MRLLLQPFGRVYGSRISPIAIRTYTCKKPIHPDPQCMPVNPKCYYIEDKCDAARDYLSNRIPLDKHMVEAQRQSRDQEFEPPCCVSRLVHRPPEEAKMRTVKEKERPPFRSMWEPPCEPHEQKYCTDMLPRFDEMFYHPSDKNRSFQRTWIECPPIRERLKKVCCLDGIEPPEIQRRVKVPCPETTCTFDYARMRHICKKAEPNLEGKCKKTFWPCCKAARCPPHCQQTRKLNPCLRLRPPSKSFSETRKWQRPRRVRECDRLHPSNCEAIREANKRMQFKFKPECAMV